MNCELSKISERLKVNKLSLKIAKTNYVLFRPRQKPITVSDTIKLDNIAVQQVEVTKFLGVLLDQHNIHTCLFKLIYNYINLKERVKSLTL